MAENQKVKVLYVDDEETNLFIFKVNFERKFPVITASSGPKALDTLETDHEEIIVVISDMRMPMMNGVEFIKKAHENNYSKIVYYILSGYAFNDEIDEALEQGLIKKFLRKPFDPKEIEMIVEDAVKQAS